ncbi:hypothetical protein ACFYRC_16200 [Streptomyces sp. NPDC005279]|uniref:hypothetical protein n=1 Tax=Streptomyces sp. NPDC005279 TaxID=3364712 RepID=UPI0036A2F81D
MSRATATRQSLARHPPLELQQEPPFLQRADTQLDQGQHGLRRLGREVCQHQAVAIALYLSWS